MPITKCPILIMQKDNMTRWKPTSVSSVFCIFTPELKSLKKKKTKLLSGHNNFKYKFNTTSSFMTFIPPLKSLNLWVKTCNLPKIKVAI